MNPLIILSIIAGILNFAAGSAVFFVSALVLRRLGMDWLLAGYFGGLAALAVVDWLKEGMEKNG